MGTKFWDNNYAMDLYNKYSQAHLIEDRNELLVYAQPLIINTLAYYYPKNLPMTEISLALTECNISIIKSLENFDPSRSKMMTYLVNTVRYAILAFNKSYTKYAHPLVELDDDLNISYPETDLSEEQIVGEHNFNDLRLSIYNLKTNEESFNEEEKQIIAKLIKCSSDAQLLRISPSAVYKKLGIPVEIWNDFCVKATAINSKFV